MSASVNLPMHHKVHKFSSGTGSPGWYRKKGHKTVVVVVVYNYERSLRLGHFHLDRNVESRVQSGLLLKLFV